MYTRQQVPGGLDWTREREVKTRRGRRYLSTAPPSKDFWRAWRDQKDELKRQGTSTTSTSLSLAVTDVVVVFGCVTPRHALDLESPGLVGREQLHGLSSSNCLLTFSRMRAFLASLRVMSPYPVRFSSGWSPKSASVS